MRIYLPTKDDPSSGKGFFCQRLHRAMSSLGCKTTTDYDQCDISLHVIHMSKARGKRVLRLNGVYHNVDVDYSVRNKKITRSLQQADAVIYQSKFSKDLCDHYLGKVKIPKAVIGNGADLTYYERVEAAKVECKYAFMAANRWRPHKRLREIIDSFLLADIPDSILFLAGKLSNSGIGKKELKKKLSTPKIIQLGHLQQDVLASYLKACHGFVHLCWFDNCPNSVVEAFAAGVPVISNNVGGTHEIVTKCNGIVCDIDKPYNLKPVHLYSPPSVDLNKIAEAMHALKDRRTVNKQEVDIMSIATRYLDFFRSL